MSGSGSISVPAFARQGPAQSEGHRVNVQTLPGAGARRLPPHLCSAQGHTSAPLSCSHSAKRPLGTLQSPGQQTQACERRPAPAEHDVPRKQGLTLLSLGGGAGHTEANARRCLGRGRMGTPRARHAAPGPRRMSPRGEEAGPPGGRGTSICSAQGRRLESAGRSPAERLSLGAAAFQKVEPCASGIGIVVWEVEACSP